MKTLRPTAASLAALAAVLVATGGANAQSPAARAVAKSAVQATGSEFRIGLSRGQIKPGSLRVEFVNFGEDDHDLAITKKGSSFTRNLGIIRPGDRGVKTFTAKRGTYVFWCTISDHKAKGMRAVLKVRR